MHNVPLMNNVMKTLTYGQVIGSCLGDFVNYTFVAEFRVVKSGR